MTVRELINSLNTIEDKNNTRVMVRGYEAGYDDIVIGNNITPAIVNMALDVNTEWYFGKHEKVDNVYGEDIDKYTIVKAIIL